VNVVYRGILLLVFYLKGFFRKVGRQESVYWVRESLSEFVKQSCVPNFIKGLTNIQEGCRAEIFFSSASLISCTIRCACSTVP
jgi:hypothetical protein